MNTVVNAKASSLVGKKTNPNLSANGVIVRLQIDENGYGKSILLKVRY